MAMKFVPKSEKEIAEMSIWPRGDYDFEVIKAERAISSENSKSPGTEFIKINVRIFNAEGAFKFVNGILHPAMDAQLRRFCVVGNMIPKYETGTLEADDCIGVAGKLRLKVKDAEGNYPAKNEISDFIVEKPVVPESSKSDNDTGGDIDF